jgi:hypothetical protein
LFIAKIILGWYVLEWWSRRSKKQYVLDWKAGVIGPILYMFLIFIPIIGWLAAVFLYLLALGALTLMVLDLRYVK